MSDDNDSPVPVGHCEFSQRCPMYPEFESQATLRIFQLHYCQRDFGNCQRYRGAKAGIMPAADLLPDGTRLRRRSGGRAPG